MLKCFEYYCQLSRKELISRLFYVIYSFNISSTRIRSNCFMRFQEMPKTHFERLPLYFLLTLTDSLEPTVYTFQSIQCIQTTNTIITTIPKRIVLKLNFNIKMSSGSSYSMTNSCVANMSVFFRVMFGEYIRIVYPIINSNHINTSQYHF